MAEQQNRNQNHQRVKKQQRPGTVRTADSVLLLGMGLAFVYWIFASLIYALTAQGRPFLDQFIRPDFNEILSRLLVLSFFMIFGSHVGYTIRQRQKAYMALAGSEEKHRTTIENIEDGYFETDRNGRFTFSNDSFRRILGYSTEQLLVLNYQRLLTPAESENVVGAFERVNQTGRAIKDLAFTIVRKDGARRWVETSVSPIIHPRGKVLGFRGILRDVTRRRQADALKQEKMAAEAASRSKSEFLANMSHEIRTPLNAIIGLVELLLESPLSREQKDDLKVVQSAAYSLLSVINDILDFSKIEAGKLELERSPFNLRDFLGEALRILAVKAHEKGLELAYRVAPDVPDRLIGDRHRFRQVLLNLIGNALKFTDSGEIVVYARQKAMENGQIVLHVAVRDTGVGIAAGKQALIFEAFRQADGSTTRKFGGTGLGLAVSSQLVNLMGGKIGVKSVLGEGSIFHFTIRFGVDTTRPGGLELPAEIDRIRPRVLVVDDNATNLKILCEMLISWKMMPHAAASCAAAEKALMTPARRKKPFDLALVDSDLPGDGALSLARRIESLTGGSTRMLFMVTSMTDQRVARLGKNSGANNLAKPIRPSDLLDAVIQSLSIDTHPYESLGPDNTIGQSFPLRSLNILVAEDTPFNQKYIRRLLDSWGCRMTLVDTGRRAMDALADHSYDLVLMDVQMPEMDGLTATAQIREKEKENGVHVPIIAMTAHAMKGDRERCLNAGMDDYVSKPISSTTLMDAIYRVVPVPRDAPENTPDPAPPEPVIHEDQRNALLEAFNGDVTFFKDVAGMFISDYPPMIDTVKQAIEDGDKELLSRTAHAIKGMARNFQADAAADAALQLEQAAAEERFDTAADLSRQLAAALTTFEQLLAKMIERL